MSNKVTVTPQQFRQMQERISGKKMVVTNLITRKKLRMNKTECAYANLLEVMKRNGEIFHYGFEEVTLKLGDDTRFTPDFFVVKLFTPQAYIIEFHETKGGFVRDDARVKFQCARKQFPYFRFKMMQLIKGSWSEIYPE